MLSVVCAFVVAAIGVVAAVVVGLLVAVGCSGLLVLCVFSFVVNLLVVFVCLAFFVAKLFKKHGIAL